MNTNKLTDFVQRLWLGKQTENVKIVFQGNTISSQFKDKNTQVIGIISLTLDNDDFGETPIEVGIGQIADLYKILAAMPNDVTLSFNHNNARPDQVASITINDTTSKVTARYMCIDTNILSKVPTLQKNLPPTDASIKLDNEFIKKYTDAFAALSDSDRFAVQCIDNELSMIINYNTSDVSSIKIDLGRSDTDFDAICFSAPVFNEILKSHKSIENGILNISAIGIANITYSTNDYTGSYYLVKKRI